MSMLSMDELRDHHTRVRWVFPCGCFIRGAQHGTVVQGARAYWHEWDTAEDITYCPRHWGDNAEVPTLNAGPTPEDAAESLGLPLNDATVVLGW